MKRLSFIFSVFAVLVSLNVKALNETIQPKVLSDSGYELDKVFCDDFQTTNLVTTYTVTHSTTIKTEFEKKTGPVSMFFEDFEAYEPGAEMVGSVEGWEYFMQYRGSSTVVVDDDEKVLKLAKGDNPYYDMVLTPQFNLAPDDPYRELTKISFSIKPGSEADLFALYAVNGDKSTRIFYLNFNAAEGTCTSYPTGLSFENVTNDYNDCFLLFDAAEKKIIACCLNGTTNNYKLALGEGCTDLARIRLSTQCASFVSEDQAAYYGFLKVETILRSTDTELYCFDSSVIPLDTTETIFEIFNSNPEAGDINYSVSSDSDWLEVAPSSGFFNESDVLTLKVKEGYQGTFRRCNMTIDGGEAGAKVVSVIYQGGNIIFQEDFNTMEDGSIVGQRGWDLDLGEVIITNAYDCNGKCMFIKNAGGNNGCSMYLPKPWYEDLTVKVSYKLFWPSNSDSIAAYVLQKDKSINEKFEAVYVLDEKGKGFFPSAIRNIDDRKPVSGFQIAPFDQWVNISYTLDLKDQKLLKFSWNGHSTNFVDWILPNPDCNFFSSWGHCVWHFTGGNALIGIDDLVVKRLKDDEIVIDTEGSGGGTIEITPLKEAYQYGDVITITAVPESGYSLKSVFCDDFQTTNLVSTYTVTHSTTIVSEFYFDAYTLTIVPTEGGKVIVEPEKETYRMNEKVTLTAIPDKEYAFERFMGTAESTNAVMEIVMDKNHRISAGFYFDAYPLTLIVGKGGSVKIEPEKETYHFDEKVTLTAIPDEGYAFKGFTGTKSSTNLIMEVVMEDYHYITAKFYYGDEKPFGEGTDSAPFEIASVANLLWLSRNVDSAAGSYSVLTSDIDLSICVDRVGGIGFEPIGSKEIPFQGSFNGRNFTISDLFINGSGMESAGLFGFVKDGEIKNLVISGAEIRASQDAGLLMGCGDGCVVKNVSVSGRVYAGANTALLIGSADNITAELVSAEGYAEGDENVAGLIGYTADSNIKNAYTIANVSAQNNAGGFVGKANNTLVAYGYAAGATVSAGSQGGVFGAVEQSEADSVFFDKAGSNDNGYGKPVETEALLKRETFADWDFINVWEMADGATKPFFRHDDTNWVKQNGVSQCKINLSGVLTQDDLNIISASLEVCLYAFKNDTMIVEPKLINALPVKGSDLKIQYNSKKRAFKYNSNTMSVTLAAFDGQVAFPCGASKPKGKLNFTSTLNEDISNALVGRKVCLSDDCMDLHVLSGTKVSLAAKGKSLVYKGTVKNVTMQVSISSKNGKFNVKYSASDTINLVTEE